MKAQRKEPQPAPEPLLLSLNDAAKRLGIGYTKLKEVIAAGQLKRVRIGGRSLIAESEIQRYVADLVANA